MYTMSTSHRKNKDIVITKSDKVNSVVILHRKLYYNTIQEVISNTSKFGKLKLKLKQTNFLN